MCHFHCVNEMMNPSHRGYSVNTVRHRFICSTGLENPMYLWLMVATSSPNMTSIKLLHCGQPVMNYLCMPHHLADVALSTWSNVDKRCDSMMRPSNSVRNSTRLGNPSTYLFPSNGSMGDTTLISLSSNESILFLKLMMVWLSMDQSMPISMGNGFVSSTMLMTSKYEHVCNPSMSIGTWLGLPIGSTFVWLASRSYKGD